MDMYINSKKPKYKKFFKSLFWWIVEIVLVIAAAYLIIEYALEKTKKSSMQSQKTVL